MYNDQYSCMPVRQKWQGQETGTTLRVISGYLTRDYIIVKKLIFA